jgi:hypothetical protein
MVRKGSSVRVRQRALAFVLEMGGVVIGGLGHKTGGVVVAAEAGTSKRSKARSPDAQQKMREQQA